MKAAVVVFPGSNCDRDCAVGIERSTGAKVDMVWHQDSDLPAGLDLIVLPGGFSYGDYLRCGAMAAQSPVMRAVVQAAEAGVAVVGICNGFQILCEAHLLPGALLRNASLKYICKAVDLDVVNAQTRFTSGFGEQRRARMTVGNGEGNFFADEAVLDRLEGEGQVVFRYRDNPNGSARDIAGIVNARGNVLGMMPHPDRAFEPELGSVDGATLFQSVFRKRLNMRLVAGLTAALLAGAAQAQTPAPATADKCDIVVQSRTGGLIEVTPAKGSAQGQILWRPVGSGPGLILLVAYPPTAIARFAEPSGVVILFQPKDQATQESLSVQAKSRNGRAWRFSGPSIVFSKDEARIAFGQEWPYGRGLLSAIADGQDLTMAVQENDQTLSQEESFSLGNIDARDTLLAQARARFAGAGCAAP